MQCLVCLVWTQIDQLTADLEEARGQHTDAESHWHASHRSQESTINELKRQLEEATSRVSLPALLH